MLNYSANSKTGYFLQRSLRFRQSASAYLSRTPSVVGNQKTFTISFWLKRGLLSYNYPRLYTAGDYGTTNAYYTLFGLLNCLAMAIFSNISASAFNTPGKFIISLK